jgi:3-hydroxymyristoyl/3-hydroxydecanoyl-(acyl carrier protein) dehydratase
MTDWPLQRLPVAADAPFFEGHFPGNPIVPGAYLLALVIESAAQRFPNHGAIEVANAKFLKMVRPGEDVSLQFTGESQSLRFALHVQQEVAVSGALKISDKPAS